MYICMRFKVPTFPVCNKTSAIYTLLSIISFSDSVIVHILCQSTTWFSEKDSICSCFSKYQSQEKSLSKTQTILVPKVVVAITSTKSRFCSQSLVNRHGCTQAGGFWLRRVLLVSWDVHAQTRRGPHGKLQPGDQPWGPIQCIKWWKELVNCNTRREVASRKLTYTFYIPF